MQKKVLLDYWIAIQKKQSGSRQNQINSRCFGS